MSGVVPYIRALAELSWCVGYFEGKGDEPEVAARLRLAEVDLRGALLELAAFVHEDGEDVLSI